MHRANYKEWEPAAAPYDDTWQGEPHSDNIAELFDTEIRRRVGEMIARAALVQKNSIAE